MITSIRCTRIKGNLFSNTFLVSFCQTLGDLKIKSNYINNRHLRCLQKLLYPAKMCFKNKFTKQFSDSKIYTRDLNLTILI